MTETSTKTSNPLTDLAEQSADEAASESDELDKSSQLFYYAISPGLNRIKLMPKPETVLKIVTYSKNLK